jgi:hypothetical protein
MNAMSDFVKIVILILLFVAIIFIGCVLMAVFRYFESCSQMYTFTEIVQLII